MKKERFTGQSIACNMCETFMKHTFCQKIMHQNWCEKFKLFMLQATYEFRSSSLKDRCYYLF